MKKQISILLMIVIMLCVAVRCVNNSDNVDPTPTPIVTPVPTHEPEPELEDYYEFGADEMVYAKGTVTYEAETGTVFGKTNVYKALINGWNGQIDAKQTSHLGDGLYDTAAEARQGLIDAGYKFVAVEIALSEGAKIGCYTTLPIEEGMSGELGGIILQIGSPISYNANVLEGLKSRLTVYTDGSQLTSSDIIQSGVWYTIVVELQLDVEQSLNGPDSFVNVGLTNGNNKEIYVSGVRYYTNNSYISDYVEVKLEDYYEFGADEMVFYKGQVTYTAETGEIYGRNNVYSEIVTGWNGEIAAKETAHLGDGPYETAAQARTGLIEKGYQYVAIDIALSEGAKIGCYTTLPIRIEMSGEIGGVILQDGSPMVYNVNVIPEHEDKIVVFSNGEQVNIGDTIEAGVWYTVVCKLMLDHEEALYGMDSYVGVILTNGNGSKIYVSSVRYYTNDSYLTDYIYETEPELEDYYEYGPEEMVYAKGTVSYEAQTETVYDKTGVYKLNINGWNGQIDAKQTSHLGDGLYETANDARNGLIAAGYKYVAIEIALTEGAKISCYTTLPNVEGLLGELGGITLLEGGSITYNANTLPELKSRMKVYGNGVQVIEGDTLEAGVWYTIVMELQLDIELALNGEDSYVNVGLTNANNLDVYVSSVRYYTNDSYLTDYIYETEPELEDYYEYGPEEMVYAKGTVSYEAQTETVYGKTGVYKLNINGWNGQIDAKQTSHLGDGLYETANDARNGLIAAGYKYVAIEIALTEGAKISCYTTLPNVEGLLGELGGITLLEGGSITYNANTLPELKSRMKVYGNGVQVIEGDTLEAGVWYTIVMELQLDIELALNGEDSYVNVGLTNANNLDVYVSSVRYYTNDSYLTDYIFD